MNVAIETRDKSRQFMTWGDRLIQTVRRQRLRFMRGVLVLLTGGVAVTSGLKGQTSNTGSWNILNIRYTHNSKWGAFGEAQIRSLKFYDHFHYYEVKGGVTRNVLSNVRLALAAGTYQTYREGGDFVKPKVNNEFRIWPQVIFLHPLGRLNTEHRYRAEFRFTSNGYRNRFRYRLAVSYPFGTSVKGYKPFLAGVGNELFLTDRVPHFERNRFQVFFNYKPSVFTTLQAGYLYQYDYRVSDETGRGFFVLGFYYELFRKLPASRGQESALKDE